MINESLVTPHLSQGTFDVAAIHSIPQIFSDSTTTTGGTSSSVQRTSNQPAKPNLTAQICKLLFIGLVILPLNSLWVVDTGITGHGVNFTRVSLFMNAIFLIFRFESNQSVAQALCSEVRARFKRHDTDLCDAVCLFCYRRSRHDPATVPAHRTRILFRCTRE